MLFTSELALLTGSVAAGPRILRAVAMATTLPFMLLTGSVHPPGGALVLTLVDSAKMQGLGWWYLICPGMLGLLVLLPMSALATWVKVRSRLSHRRSAEAPWAPRGVSRSARAAPRPLCSLCPGFGATEKLRLHMGSRWLQMAG